MYDDKNNNMNNENNSNYGFRDYEPQFPSIIDEPIPHKDYKKKKSKVSFKNVIALSLVAAISFSSLGFGIGYGSGFYKQRINSNKTKAPTAYSSINYVDTTSISNNNTIVDVIKLTQNSVVSINTQTTINTYMRGTTTAQSAGSGIIFHEDDDYIYIVTNNHVINGVESMTVSVDDTNEIDATVLGRDSQSDIAVLTIDKGVALQTEGFNYKVAVFGNDETMEVGETVIAIGNAAGEGKSATVGIISAKDKEIAVESDQKLKVIQTDAAINPGNSGGALVNLSGQVIGINTAKQANIDVEGMGYAVPSSTLKDIAEEIVETGTVLRPYLGINVFTITEQLKESYKLDTKGIFLYASVEGSGAYEAGLTQGDIIVGYDGKEVLTMEQLQGLIEQSEVNEAVEITFYRQGNKMNVSAMIKNANEIR